MNTIFVDDFSAHRDGNRPDGWIVEEHADPFHSLAEVREGAYRILFTGNLHLPLIPPVCRGILSLTVRSDIYSASCSLRIYFRYDPQSRSGYCISHSWGEGGMQTVFGVYRNGNFTTLARKAFEKPGFVVPVAEDSRLRLEIGEREFVLYHQDECVARFEDPVATFDRPGLIALDRGNTGRFYVMAVRKVQIESDEPEPETPLWPDRRIEFPRDVNGITDPWYFQVSGSRCEHRVKLNVTVAGGPANRPPPWDSRGLRGNSRMTRPYVRIEFGDGRVFGPYYLHTGSLGLKEHWEPRSSGFLPCDSEGPARHDLLLDELPADAMLALGYEHYAAEDRQALAGGPSEIFLCPETGEIIYSGPTLAPDAAALEILSAPDKKIVALIPKDDQRYEQALAFAQNNHFFFESEPARLHFRVRHRKTDWRSENLTLWVMLENAFQEPAGAERPVPLQPAKDQQSQMFRRKFGVETLAMAPFDFPGLAVGVYHARAALRRGAETLLETRRAFEIMSDDPAAPCPPLASGLPDLIPMITDYATATNSFDPWVGQGVDAAHYLANSTHHILPARKNRIWDLVHLYRRRWVLELHQRMTPERDPERNADVVPHADRVWWNQRHDLWRGYYDKVVIEALVKFLQSGAFQPGPAGTCLDVKVIEKTGKLSDAMYRELSTGHWKAWVEFFNGWMLHEHVPAMHARLRAVNPTAEWMTYSIYPPYGSVYKGSYFARYTGRDLRNGFERFYNGPMLFEDYPHMCGYTLHHGVFMMAAMKLEAPRLRQYPEVYGVNGCAGDSHTLYGRPPYANSHPPAGFLRKRVFEYVFGAVWFDAQGFRYWDDNGFNASDWTREHYEEVIRAWGLVVRHRPVKPLKTTAFAVSRAACLAHPDTFMESRVNPDFEGKTCFHDVVNTAEEDTAFAYEEARRDGQQAGFVADLEAVDQLDPDDVHTLVLPPLTGVSPETQAAVRRLHERGVALVGFEESGGLEDLFGVSRRKRPAALHTVRATPTGRDGLWKELPGAAEQCETANCLAAYDAKDAQTLIEGLDKNGRVVAPALVCHQTQWGRTAFFTMPPTMVKRLDLKRLVSYGKESRSVLMNRVMALVLRWVGRPMVETTAGKLLAFRDKAGGTNVVVMEDAHPAPAMTIRPVVTLHMPSLNPRDIECDRDWHIVETRPDRLRLSLCLGPHESAHLLIRGASGPQPGHI